MFELQISLTLGVWSSFFEKTPKARSVFRSHVPLRQSEVGARPQGGSMPGCSRWTGRVPVDRRGLRSRATHLVLVYPAAGAWGCHCAITVRVTTAVAAQSSSGRATRGGQLILRLLHLFEGLRACHCTRGSAAKRMTGRHPARGRRDGDRIAQGTGRSCRATR